jgi:hypothetical protein
LASRSIASGHERSAPGFRFQQAQCLKRQQGFSQGRPADTELMGELTLRRYLFTGFQLPGLNHGLDFAGNRLWHKRFVEHSIPVS